MFGFGKKAAIRQRAIQEVRVLRHFCEGQRQVDAAAFWSDPYLVGFAHGVVGAITSPLTGTRLSETAKARIWLEAVQVNGGDIAAIGGFMARHAEDEAFQRGMAQGIDVRLLEFGAIPSQGYTEDIRWAVERGPIVQEEIVALDQRPIDEKAAASIALMTRYLQRHLHDAI
ncbi:hypothetical protein [Sphingomonas rustica]